MARSAFNKNSVPFSFDKAVAEAYAQFPELKEKVFFLDAAKGRLVHSDPDIRARTIATMNQSDAMREGLNMEMENRRLGKSSAVMELGEGKDAIYFVFLYLAPDMESALGKKHSHGQNQQLVFDHEFAHAAMKQAHGPKLLAETTADAYAALRWFQRHGTDDGIIEKLMKRRAAYGFFNDDGEHFTAPALEKILRLKDTADFKALSPKETQKLAAKIARDCVLTPEALKTLTPHFKKTVKSLMNGVNDDAPLRNLADRAMKARAPAMKKWGGMAVKAFMDKDIKLNTGEGKTVKLQGPYWREAKRKLG